MFGSSSSGLMTLLLATLLALTACGGTESGENVARTTAPPVASPVAGAAMAASTAVAPDSEPGTEEDGGFWLGEPRDDVSRFFGLYGDAGDPDQGRGQFFVTEAKRPKYAEQSPEIPPGYLAIGAVWGDVAPMAMKSLSESTFENVDRSDFAPPEPIVVEFEFGPDGNAVALVFKSGFDEFGRRERLGDLPAEWR